MADPTWVLSLEVTRIWALFLRGDAQLGGLSEG